MVHRRLGRRRLTLAALGAAAAIAMPWRRAQAVHFAWEAYLQEGTCEDPTAGSRVRLGDPVFGMRVGVPGTPASEEPLRFTPVGPAPRRPVLTSTATVDIPFDDLLSAPHSIVVETVDLESESRMPITCGNVGGVPTDSELLFGLRAIAADTTGVAWLRGNADDTTTVTLFLTQGLSTGEELHPPAMAPGTPAAEQAAPTDVVIGSYDIYFDPNEVTIPADTDVRIRLPNNGQALHNVSVTDHKNPDVPNLGIDVDLAPGAEEIITVNAPAGDYYFFCNVPGHEAAGMFGTMHVV